MAAIAIPAPTTVEAPIRIPLRELFPFAVFAGVFMLFLVYLVGCEQGAVHIVGGHMVHEYMHDARHLLGFPCH
jgi:Probable cobalt transporter subunit (CbtB)